MLDFLGGHKDGMESELAEIRESLARSGETVAAAFDRLIEGSETGEYALTASTEDLGQMARTFLALDPLRFVGGMSAGAQAPMFLHSVLVEDDKGEPMFAPLSPDVDGAHSEMMVLGLATMHGMEEPHRVRLVASTWPEVEEPINPAAGPLGGIRGHLKSAALYYTPEGEEVLIGQRVPITLRGLIGEGDPVTLGEPEPYEVKLTAASFLRAVFRVNEVLYPLHDEIRKRWPEKESGGEAA